MVVVAGAVLVGIGLGLRFPEPAAVEFVGGGAFLPSPEQELETVIEVIPFDARLPSRVPKGLSLYEIGNSGPDEDGLTHSFDVKYRSRTDPKRRLHIWQASIPDLPTFAETDHTDIPILSEGKVEIEGSDWLLVKLDRPSGPMTVLERRFNDGVTLSLDGQGFTTAQLVGVARSLTTVQTISNEWLLRLGLVRRAGKG